METFSREKLFIKQKLKRKVSCLVTEIKASVKFRRSYLQNVLKKYSDAHIENEICKCEKHSTWPTVNLLPSLCEARLTVELPFPFSALFSLSFLSNNCSSSFFLFAINQIITIIIINHDECVSGKSKAFIFYHVTFIYTDFAESLTNQ